MRACLYFSPRTRDRHFSACALKARTLKTTEMKFSRTKKKRQARSLSAGRGHRFPDKDLVLLKQCGNRGRRSAKERSTLHSDDEVGRKRPWERQRQHRRRSPSIQGPIQDARSRDPTAEVEDEACAGREKKRAHDVVPSSIENGHCSAPAAEESLSENRARSKDRIVAGEDHDGDARVFNS